MIKKIRLGSLLFDVLNYSLISLFALICLFPFIYVFSFSITPYSEYLQNPLKLIPTRLEFDAYQQIFKMPLMWSGYRVTILITLGGVALNIFLLLTAAYPLAKKNLKGRTVILMLITFTMFFNGGLIPNFYLIKSLGLYNNLLALIIPGALGAYSLLLMKTFIADIPDSLEESAIIDGANEITVLTKIIVPLSTAAIATFVVFHSVTQWNTFFNAIIYTSKRALWPLMLILREMVVEDGMMGQDATNDASNVTIFTVKMATIIFATLPILIVYPFAQKYFVKGIMVGSVKG